MSPRQNDNSIFSVLCISLLITSVVLSWTVDLILLSGDVHPNPGPDSGTSLADFSVSNSVNSFSALANHLSIIHLNLQSILPELDLIKCESLAYDVLVFSESWLKPVTRPVSFLSYFTSNSLLVMSIYPFLLATAFLLSDSIIC